MKQRFAIGIGSTLLLLGVVGYPRVSAQPVTAPATMPAAGQVNSITLPAVAYELPPGGKGRPVVATMCAICHTPRYIVTQPRLSRQTWTAEVEKMRKVFGAPVADAQVPDIVDYLVSIRGADDTPAPGAAKQ